MKGVKKMKDEIKGISCDAKNCIHHDVTNTCMAGHIKVGTSNAKSETETKCETFECNDNCNCN